MPSLRLSNLTKSFGAVRAVAGVSLDFEGGRIHAVVGENGAGKSTLLKMAAGVLSPDAGGVLAFGRPLSPHTAAEAIGRGIAMVQQHFALIEVFTALENVVLGAEPTGALGWLQLGGAREKMKGIARELGAELPLDAVVSALGVGDRQRLEIARALYRDAKVLILDEPTAVLTPGEADALYATLRRLAGAGRAIIVVTHKLDEVVQHCDVVTVLRRGELVVTRAVKDAAPFRTSSPGKDLAEAIMGGSAPEPITRVPAQLGEEALSVRDVRRGRALRGVTFSVKRSEVVGIAGVEGNGQRELVRVLAGLEVEDDGDVVVLGTPVPPRRRAAAIAVVHEDRQREGLVLDATVRENLVLGELARFARLGVLDARKIDEVASKRLRAAGVTPPDLDAVARALSGGNQQKIVMTRAVAKTELPDERRVLVLAHPTRGVDLGAARAIHAAILDAAKRGVAVLVLGADLGELRTLCDRILVIARGAIVAELPPTAADRTIGAAMLGAPAASEAVE